MEDVLGDEDDDAEFSPIPVLYNQDCHDEVAKNSPIINWYQTYDFAFDHTDHFFSSKSSPMDEVCVSFHMDYSHNSCYCCLPFLTFIHIHVICFSYPLRIFLQSGLILRTACLV